MTKRILVADESPMIRRALCQLFAVEEGYDICAEARNGQEAIDLALQERPDLIILDQEMPVLSGLEAARQLKKMMRDVPIILFTHYDTVIARSGIEIAADLVVSKNDAGRLIEHVRSLVPV